ncbi:MAG: DUF2818 family protein [Paludibacterium sp.]|uniref:DUF2818 family protein n=1 Tax=Paludibacterium sp. TaxID=1917523 RepID=UPI0025D20D83|nr:DUF2818 family protein [Paludibacterium sp.]MBV8047969.1 DUF2818 family protein [Paludibacterium sp.]MBV8649137.1 DUF2818 family protein [Paludibacterium sp.]
MQASVTLLLIVAIIAANLPFLLTRIGGVLPVAHKRFAWRLLEFVVLYLGVGLFARLLEARLMPVHVQDWQFYVSTFALFVVFAFPGFTWRYFWRVRR